MTGVRATAARYVLPLDADDRLERGALGRLAAALDADASAAAAWGWYQRFDCADYLQQTAPSLDPWQVTHQNDWPATAMFRRDALLSAGGWQLRGGYEDWDLWMALAAQGRRGIGIPAVTYYYRLRGGRMLQDAAGRHAEILAVLRARHTRLFADRWKNWRASSAPLSLRIALPIIRVLPLSDTRRRLLAGLACHLAYRRGIRALADRLRAGA
jgi:hypothetical protein